MTTHATIFDFIVFSGMVDLPEDNREAAMNAITLPEVKIFSYKQKFNNSRLLLKVCYVKNLNHD